SRMPIKKPRRQEHHVELGVIITPEAFGGVEADILVVMKPKLPHKLGDFRRGLIRFGRPLFGQINHILKGKVCLRTKREQRDAQSETQKYSAHVELTPFNMISQPLPGRRVGQLLEENRQRAIHSQLRLRRRSPKCDRLRASTHTVSRKQLSEQSK